MKKFVILIAFITLYSCKSFSQKACDVFSATEMYWYGFDFSYAKMIGSDFNDPMKIRDEFFFSWNELVIKESSKYNLQKFFRKSNVLYNLSIVNARNYKVDYTKLVSYNSSDVVNLNESDISKEIKTYNIDKDKGIGLVFFIESFNKFQQQAYVSVVFFDIATKTVLFVKKMNGKAVGVAFRNYWAGALFNIMKQCDKSYSAWMAEYCNK